MQQYFFFLLVLFLCFSASAQTHSSEAQKIFDTAVNSYNTGNVPEAEALFKKAEEAAKKEKNHEIWWACYNYYGAIAIGKKDFDKGIEFFWKAFYIALEGDHIENLQFLIKNVAAGYANKGDMTAAQKYANISELFKAATEIEIKAQETFNQGRIKEGIQLYVDAFQYYKDAGIDKVTANILIFLTHIMMKNGFCNDAYLRFEDAQRYDLSFMINNEGIADTFYAIGLCDGNKGDYEAVCVKWEKALQYAQKSNNKENLLFYKKELAIAYDNAKRYSYAIAMYRQALDLATEMKNYQRQFDIAVNFGSMYIALFKDKEGMELLKQAAGLFEKHKLRATEAASILFKELGNSERTKKNSSAAKQYLEKALDLCETNKWFQNIADIYLDLGELYEFDYKQFDKALSYYEKAFVQKKDNMRTLSLLGRIHVKKGSHAKGEQYLKEAIALADANSGNNGELDVRFVGDIHATPRFFLLMSYVMQKKNKEAFLMMEEMSNTIFKKQLTDKNQALVKKTTVDDVRSALGSDTAVITYTTGMEKSVILYADNKNFASFEKSDAEVGALYKGSLAASAQAAEEKLRGLKKTDKTKAETLDPFFSLMQYYRILLSTQAKTESEKKMTTEIGRKLYELIFKELEPYISDKKELLIMPNSILAYIPFETFIMPDGRYLIEKYDIRYIQSLSVYDILSRRNYASGRKQMLAFGNPVYETITYKNKEEEEQAAFDASIEAKTKQNAGLRNDIATYIDLGYGPAVWEPLPGTEGELTAIKKEFPDATVFSESLASEDQFKKLAVNGSLKDYQMFHFAMHGIMIPQIRGLSALIFSQKKGMQQNNDGYLSMRDLEEISLNADFVNLSACETGIGQVYFSEGMVGLTQAFMAAGANSVSVSLWSVQDDSTRDFMAEFYRLVKTGSPYHHAMSEVKRKFIKEGKYAHPFYWAPFVFYGVEPQDNSKVSAAQHPIESVQTVETKPVAATLQKEPQPAAVNVAETSNLPVPQAQAEKQPESNPAPQKYPLKEKTVHPYFWYGVGSLVVAGLTVGGGLLSYKYADKYYKDATANYDTYMKADSATAEQAWTNFRDSRNKADTAATASYILYGTAGAFAVLGGILMLITGKEPDYSLYINPLNNEVGISFNY